MRELLEQHVPHVYRFALRLTGADGHAADDLTQETMLRAWRNPGRLTDADAEAVRTWLFRITANLWRDQLRRGRVRRAYADGVRPAGRSPLPQGHVEQDEDADRAMRALDALPPRQRDVLYLSACEGLALAQVAQVLEISPGAVKASLSLARQRMREELDEDRTGSHT